MSDFIIKHNVPILDEHILYDEEGNELARIDETRLQKIAAKANKRIAETGDLAPIVIGHTKDDSKEEDQPDIVGYASNFRVMRFLKTSRKAIVATFKFFKQSIDRVKKYPRRSVELWLDDWTIDPISLLGATTPERDLGLLRFEKGGKRKVRIIYAKGKPMVDQQKQLIDAVMKAFEQTAVYKWACQKMEEEGQSEEGDEQPEDEMADMGQAEGMEHPESPVPGEDDELAEEQEAGQDLEPEAEPEEATGKEPMQYAAGASASVSSGSNTFTPSMRAKMKKNQDKGKIARYERTQKQMYARIKQLEARNTYAERERDLIQLESEGVDFDRAEEMEDVMDMPETLYQKHLTKMRTRYSKAPLWGGANDAVTYSRTEGRGTPSDKKALTDQAVALALAEGIDFGTALQRIGG